MHDDGRALEIVGVSAFDERVYREVLACPGITVRELARRSRESTGRIQASLARLRDKGLVSRMWGRAPRWMAMSPGTAIRSLARSLRGELDRLSDTADELEAAFRAAGPVGDAAGQFEVLAGPEELGRWFVRLHREAEKEVLTLDRPPYVLDYRNPLQSERLRAGVRYRTIYAPEALQHEGALSELDAQIQAGEAARVLPGLPLKMVIADRRLALMPLHVQPPLTRSVVIQGSTMVVALVELFERLWREAHPINAEPARHPPARPSSGAPDRPEPADGLGPDDRRLLTLLAAGLKDDAIARQLGTSSRSLRRRLRGLLNELNSETRFQAGAEARRRGLV
ncbi:TrmB family transcriptional regulator [Nonomuraea aridisoli]|uniref:TrmB family transcriptional regulator n=1 Tax=Nonomuraea aridisoli TaxID=2070368 RepID=UPI0015E8897A|nr:winged helix-turn-helix transcriptional regulator [Nonomuraea aridisoli]